MTSQTNNHPPEDDLVENLTKLVQDAYEEGVDDGIEHESDHSGEGGAPQWIDSVARIEALKAMPRISSLEADKRMLVEALRGCLEHMEWSTKQGSYAYFEAHNTLTKAGSST